MKKRASHECVPTGKTQDYGSVMNTHRTREINEAKYRPDETVTSQRLFAEAIQPSRLLPFITISTVPGELRALGYTHLLLILLSPGSSVCIFFLVYITRIARLTGLIAAIHSWTLSLLLCLPKRLKIRREAICVVASDQLQLLFRPGRCADVGLHLESFTQRQIPPQIWQFKHVKVKSLFMLDNLITYLDLKSCRCSSGKL